MSDDPLAPVEIRVELPNELVAWELAQFVKRITFGAVREVTDGVSNGQARDNQAYVMLEGLSAIAKALREKGYAPR